MNFKKKVFFLLNLVESSTLRLITFDKINSSEKNIESCPISRLYEGFKWVNVWYMHEQWAKKTHPDLSGWMNSFTNEHHSIAFNGQGNSMSICVKNSHSGTFTFISFKAAAAWHDDLQIDIIGKRLKQEISKRSIFLQFNKSEIFLFNWKDLDEIQFVPIDGKSHPGTSYTEKYFALTWILIK